MRHLVLVGLDDDGRDLGVDVLQDRLASNERVSMESRRRWHSRRMAVAKKPRGWINQGSAFRVPVLLLQLLYWPLLDCELQHGEAMQNRRVGTKTVVLTI